LSSDAAAKLDADNDCAIDADKLGNSSNQAGFALVLLSWHAYVSLADKLYNNMNKIWDIYAMTKLIIAACRPVAGADEDSQHHLLDPPPHTQQGGK